MRLPLLAFLLVLASAPFARAGEDPYTVSGISVDATAASAIEAQTIAINSGQQRAWSTLYRKLTKAQDWPKQPTLDATQLQRLIRNYLPVNERRSTTRYVASMTYVFNPDGVRRVLRQANIAYADMQAHPVLVVPMSPAYQARAPWTLAFANPRYTGGAVPLLLPHGDAVDAAALGPLKFATATWQDIEPVASRLHATEAYLALAEPANGQFVVKLRRVAQGNSPTIPDVTMPVPPKTPPAKVYGAAADATASAIVDAWKAHSAIDFGKRSHLLAEVRIESLDAWSAMQQKLATVPNVTEVAVVAMNIGEARVSISYVGTSEQLTQTLQQAGFALANDDGAWWLSAEAATTDTATQ